MNDFIDKIIFAPGSHDFRSDWQEAYSHLCWLLPQKYLTNGNNPARRLWFESKGSLPEGNLMRTCDNLNCVNPSHRRTSLPSSTVTKPKPNSPESKLQSLSTTKDTHIIAPKTFNWRGLKYHSVQVLMGNPPWNKFWRTWRICNQYGCVNPDHHTIIRINYSFVSTLDYPLFLQPLPDHQPTIATHNLPPPPSHDPMAEIEEACDAIQEISDWRTLTPRQLQERIKVYSIDVIEQAVRAMKRTPSTSKSMLEIMKEIP